MLPPLIAWARARTRFDTRGMVAQGVLVTALIVLAIIALLLWIVTGYHVSRK